MQMDCFIKDLFYSCDVFCSLKAGFSHFRSGMNIYLKATSRGVDLTFTVLAVHSQHAPFTCCNSQLLRFQLICNTNLQRLSNKKPEQVGTLGLTLLQLKWQISSFIGHFNIILFKEYSLYLVAAVTQLNSILMPQCSEVHLYITAVK